MLRRLALIAVLWIAACTNANDLGRRGVNLGDFALGHNVVVAPRMTKGPASREASEDEWKAALTAAVDERFRRYEETGSKLYHIAVSVEGYVLAQPGVPLVLSPKSALIFNVTIWDDAARKKLNEKPHQITVLETASGETLLGSGLTQTKEEQLRNLSRNAAKEIQTWMQSQMEAQGWFGGAAAANAGPGAKAEPSAETAAQATAATAAKPQATAQPAPAPAAQTAPAPAAQTAPAPVAETASAPAAQAGARGDAAAEDAPAETPAQKRRRLRAEAAAATPATPDPSATAVPAPEPTAEPTATPTPADPVIPDETILEPAVSPPPAVPAPQG